MLGDWCGQVQVAVRRLDLSVGRADMLEGAGSENLSWLSLLMVALHNMLACWYKLLLVRYRWLVSCPVLLCVHLSMLASRTRAE